MTELLRLRAEGWTVARLSSRFGISWRSVDYRIHNGTTRARVPVPPRPPRPRRPEPSLYKSDSLGHYLLRERHSPMVEAALCALTPGFRKYLDEDDELRAKRGRGR